MSATRPQLASALAAASGLDYHVAMNWLNAENSVQGHGTNPLGILCGNSRGSGLEVGCAGRFAVYRSSVDGVKAAAWLVAHGPYQGVRNAIAKGTPAQQRAAIVASPWAAGNYHGGSGFSSAGIAGHGGSSPGPAGGAPAMAAPAMAAAAKAASSGSSGGGTFAPTPAALPAFAIAEGKKLDAGDVLYITRTLTAAGWFPGWGGAHSQGVAALSHLVGQAWGPDVRAQLAAMFAASPATKAGDIPAVDFLNFAWLPGFAVNVAILAAVLVLGYRGVRELVG